MTCVSQSRSGGVDALTIDSSQNVGIDQTSPSSFYSGARNLVIGNTSQAESGLTIVSSGGASSYGEIFFADGTTGNEAYRGFIQYNHDTSTDSLLFGTAGSEKMRLTSSGTLKVKLNTGTFSTNIAEFQNPSATTIVGAYCTGSPGSGQFYVKDAGDTTKVLLNSIGDSYFVGDRDWETLQC